MSTTDDKSTEKTRIGAFERAKIKVLWEVSGKTQREIADLYGVSHGRISQILKEMKAGERGCKMEEAIVGAIAEDVKTHAQKNMERVNTFKERVTKYVDHLMGLSIKEIADAQKDGGKYALTEKNLKAIRMALLNVKTGREQFWAIHGLDKDDSLGDELPDLNIGVFTEEDMAAINQERERAAVGATDQAEYDQIMKEAEEMVAGMDGEAEAPPAAELPDDDDEPIEEDDEDADDLEDEDIP